MQLKSKRYGTLIKFKICRVDVYLFIVLNSLIDKESKYEIMIKDDALKVREGANFNYCYCDKNVLSTLKRMFKVMDYEGTESGEGILLMLYIDLYR